MRSRTGQRNPAWEGRDCVRRKDYLRISEPCGESGFSLVITAGDALENGTNGGKACKQLLLQD